MKDYLNEFIGFLSHVKKSSQNTIDSYKRDILKFCEYLCEHNIKDAALVSEELINNYFLLLEASGKSFSTITRVVSSVKMYYKFLNSIGKRSDIPLIKTNSPKVQKILPEILTTDEVQLLLSQPDIKDLKGIRDKAMLEILYATGIKVSELISITVDSVNLQLGFIKLGSKRTERTVPLYKSAIRSLSLYINQVRNSIISDVNQQVLFSNMNGGVLTRQGVWKIIKGYANSAGITKDITPHTIRHSFASHLLENGANLEDVKDLLGYSDISSTQIYTQIIKNKYSNVYSKYHPLGRK